MNKPVKYTCPKCGSTDCTTFDIRASGSLFTSILDIQNKKFNAVVCSSCRYTEFYHAPRRRRSEI